MVGDPSAPTARLDAPARRASYESNTPTRPVSRSAESPRDGAECPQTTTSWTDRTATNCQRTADDQRNQWRQAKMDQQQPQFHHSPPASSEPLVVAPSIQLRVLPSA